MKPLLKSLLLALCICFIFYVIFSVCALSPDISEWNTEYRYSFSSLSALFGVSIGMFYYFDSKNKLP